jgi:hypothetical protein
MSIVKNAPRTATTIVIRSDANTRITHTRDPFFNLMRRLFQEDASAVKGQKFLNMVEERQRSGNPLKTDEWKDILDTLGTGRASFYAMRNKLLGGGFIAITNKEYHLSGLFSKDLVDMAKWWWSAVLNNPEESL